jgi:hypothetical protein
VEMKSVAMHEEFRKEDASVKSLGTMNNWHGNRHLAAGRRKEPKELIRGDCASRRKFPAACRNVSRRAAVPWHKGNVFRKIRTQGSCSPRKEWAAAGRKMTCCAKVARRKGRKQGLDCTENLEKTGAWEETKGTTAK